MSWLHSTAHRRLGTLLAVLLIITAAACADPLSPTESRNDEPGTPQLGVGTSPGPQLGVATTPGPQLGVGTSPGPQLGVGTSPGPKRGVGTSPGPRK
jgi:hypothetical protein